MDNYYIYRVNVSYDGFYPENIDERSDKDRFVFNWRGYLDNVEEGDIVLVYFLGPGCQDGIYAVTKVEEIIENGYENNVVAEILYASRDNWTPIIAKKDHVQTFRDIMYRPRGAEIILSSSNEESIVSILRTCTGLTRQLTKLNVTLPGISLPAAFSLDAIPLVNPQRDFKPWLKRRELTSAFWIRPRQASWMKYIRWMSYLSSLFYKYKSGDMTYTSEFARKLGEAIEAYVRDNSIDFDLMLSVPLCEYKKQHREIDRVRLLCEELSEIIQVPYEQAFVLQGKISRVSYKRRGLSTHQFITDYRGSLSISRKCVRNIRNGNGNILLVDDVLTDGVTTDLVRNFLHESLHPMELSVHVATLAVMAKVGNISPQLQKRWRN